MSTALESQASLYFHIPFCTKKCPYCHFFVVPNEPSSHVFFLQGLKKEWELIKSQLQGYSIVSIYFGGGTPSLLGAGAIAQILSWISASSHVVGDVEVTLEANPDHVSLKEIQQFQNVGINRMSLGLQSLDNSLLKTLGRTHCAQTAMQAVNLVAQAGITNISIDLMYEIPGQTLAAWQSTLDQLTLLPITHLSLYNLTFEPGAVFYKKRKEFSCHLPSPEESLQMLKVACRHLEQMGLQQYEISAFAQASFESRHNTGYWTGRPFLGLGPSAFSYWDGHRFRNVCHLKKYLDQLNLNQLPRDFDEKLSTDASLHEKLAIHLRLLKGAPRQQFPVNSKLIQSLEKKGWISLSPTHITLTKQGRLFYDSVAEEIVLS